MSNSTSQTGSQPYSPEEMASALFANLVMQQTNMALMFLGVTPHPETGQPLFELDSAELVIDQLEMLKTKTKNNLDAREQQLLQQSLTTLRMAFVEAVNRGAPAGASAAPDSGAASQPAGSSSPQNPPNASASDDESRKKFSKKY